jgi:hypothetical protein
VAILNQLTGFLMGALLWPFHSPWGALAAAALATSVLVLLIVRRTSSPATIARARRRLIARVLELVLFRHDAMVSFGAAGRILSANLVYLATLLVPLAVSLVPMALILAQLSCWFDARPLQVGEAAVLEVKLRDGMNVMDRPLIITGAEAVRVETEGVRIPRLTEIDWRVRGARPGVDWLEIRCGDEPAVRKHVAVGDDFQKVSRQRSRADLWEQFLNPAEAPIEGPASVERVRVRYPARELYLGSTEINWLLAFFVLTIVLALILKRPLNVEI